jgi:hypothetical protein
MPQAYRQQPDKFACRNCDYCGAAMRLIGIESDPTASWADLRTYMCEQCEAFQTETVPLRTQFLPREGNPVMAISPLFADAAFGPEATRFLTSAFEDAWKRLSASDGSLVAGSDAASARERLAKCVIEIGKRGVKNRERFIKTALARFREIERGRKSY